MMGMTMMNDGFSGVWGSVPKPPPRPRDISGGGVSEHWFWGSCMLLVGFRFDVIVWLLSRI